VQPSIQTKPCRLCSEPFEPKAFQVRKNHYTCRACLNVLAAAYRDRREARGLTRRSGGPTKPSQHGVRMSSGMSQAAKTRNKVRYQTDPAFRLKVNARSRLRTAICKGRLAKQPCEVCGSIEVEAHHDDYSQPYNVRWLCPTHHREHHKRLRASVAA
jgi:hypothetical protein